MAASCTPGVSPAPSGAQAQSAAISKTDSAPDTAQRHKNGAPPPPPKTGVPIFKTPDATRIILPGERSTRPSAHIVGWLMGPFETVEIDEMTTACSGGGPLGHPRVYLNLAPAG